MSNAGPQENVNDHAFRGLVAAMCARPGMYVNPPNADIVLAYIDGYDTGRDGGPLREWLIVKFNFGYNTSWNSVMLEVVDSVEIPLEGDEEHTRLKKLGMLFEEFFKYREANGVTKISYDYAKWLRRTGWYSGPLKDSKKS